MKFGTRCGSSSRRGIGESVPALGDRASQPPWDYVRVLETSVHLVLKPQILQKQFLSWSQKLRPALPPVKDILRWMGVVLVVVVPFSHIA